MKMYQLEAIFFHLKKYLQFLAYKLYATIFIAVRSYFKLQVPSLTQSEDRLRAQSSLALYVCMYVHACARTEVRNTRFPPTPAICNWELTLEVQSPMLRSGPCALMQMVLHFYMPQI